MPHNTGEFVVGVVLRAHHDGSFDHLLAAFTNLRGTGRLAKLVIFATQDAPQPSCQAALQVLVQEVQWVPGGSVKRDLLQRCDVLVSLQEGVPFLVLQAMFLRVPIITTAVRFPEVLRNHSGVIFIQRGNISELQGALIRQSEKSRRMPNPGFVPEEIIAKHYSDTYLWREDCSRTVNGRESKRRLLIKRRYTEPFPPNNSFSTGVETASRLP